MSGWCATIKLRLTLPGDGGDVGGGVEADDYGRDVLLQRLDQEADGIVRQSGPFGGVAVEQRQQVVEEHAAIVPLGGRLALTRGRRCAKIAGIGATNTTRKRN